MLSYKEAYVCKGFHVVTFIAHLEVNLETPGM